MKGIFISLFLSCAVCVAIGQIDNYKFVNILSGIGIKIVDNEIHIKLDGESLLKADDFNGRHDHGDNNHSPSKKRPNIFERIRTGLMMIPLIMQVLSLPGALASIKLSLLKSLIVGKIALIIMLFNLLKSYRSTEVVVVHQPPPTHYNHYYSPYEEEDQDKGWFG